MAKRAKQPFTVWTGEDGITAKRSYTKDEVVPTELAKGRDALVYDDGAPAPSKRAAKKAAADAA